MFVGQFSSPWYMRVMKMQFSTLHRGGILHLLEGEEFLCETGHRIGPRQQVCNLASSQTSQKCAQRAINLVKIGPACPNWVPPMYFMFISGITFMIFTRIMKMFHFIISGYNSWSYKIWTWYKESWKRSRWQWSRKSKCFTTDMGSWWK